jgi:hypothetical protein
VNQATKRNQQLRLSAKGAAASGPDDTSRDDRLPLQHRPRQHLRKNGEKQQNGKDQLGHHDRHGSSPVRGLRVFLEIRRRNRNASRRFDSMKSLADRAAIDANQLET